MTQKQGGAGVIDQKKALFFHLMQLIQAKFTNPKEYKKVIMMATLLMTGGSSFFTKGGEVINIYVCSVTIINSKFKIGVTNFMVVSEAEDGNIFHEGVATNPPAASEAATAPPEAGGIENQET